jgi:predicted secreted protein
MVNHKRITISSMMCYSLILIVFFSPFFKSTLFLTTDLQFDRTGDIPPSFRLSAKGVDIWNHTFGGVGYEEGLSVVKCADNGYAIAGYTNSSGAGDYDVWLVRTNSTGHHVWNRTYGGSDPDYGYQVAQCPDGGFLIASQTQSFGVGGSDVWLIRTNSQGIHVWNQTYGSTDADYCRSMVRASNGDVVIAGITLGFNANSSDLWLIRTDRFGNHLWNSTIGGNLWRCGFRSCFIHHSV